MVRVPESAAADAQAFRICRETCRRSGGDFYLSTFFLPRQKRDATHAIFAFCSLVADSVRMDEIHAASPAPTTIGVACCSTNTLDGRLDLLRQRLDHLYASPAAVPFSIERGVEQGIAYAFGRTIQRYPVPREYLSDLVEGCRIEATVPRFATWKSVDRYLALRWGSVALAMAAVLGLTSSDARDRVIDLGKAVGLTKLLRDLPKRVAGGNVPLPQEDLAACSYAERELLSGVTSDRFHDLMRLETDRARQLFASGRLAIPWLAGDSSRLMAATVATLYGRSLDRVSRSSPALSTWQRVRLLPVIWAAARA